MPELPAAGHRVRCRVCTPGKLRDHPWVGQGEIVQGDVTDAAPVGRAMGGVDVSYYLVRALGTGRDAARHFSERARRAGVPRVVYLGGLTPAGVAESSLPPHLRYRAEVGRIFMDCGVPAAVLRAPSSSVRGPPASRCSATSPSGRR
ncbi:uncharacterized protein YbjT (DUF2867 family) [Streptomyces sp. SAI-170]